MTIGKLKGILQNALDFCDDYEDDDKIVFVSNTYFVRDALVFIGCCEGYLDLEEIEIEDKEEEIDE